VSYGLAVAGDARMDLQAMDTWLQEEFWDEFERLAADPSVLPVDVGRDGVLYEFSRDAGGLRHVVAITLRRNDFGRILTVLGITHKSGTCS